jgi:hypothetical protein
MKRISSVIIILALFVAYPCAKTVLAGLFMKSETKKSDKAKEGQATQGPLPAADKPVGSDQEVSASAIPAKFPAIGRPSGKADPAVEKIQNQIQEILRVNEGLRVQYKDQAADIQKIMDQARIHREILKGLDDNRPLGQKPVELLDAKEILRQEKIRLIREQTTKNQAMLEDLKKKRSELQKTTANLPQKEKQPSKST